MLFYHLCIIACNVSRETLLLFIKIQIKKMNIIFEFKKVFNNYLNPDYICILNKYVSRETLII